MKLLGIISVGFDVTDKLPIIFAFVRYWRKMGVQWDSTSTQILTDAGKEVGLEVNIEKTEYMLLSRHQHAGQNHDIKVANRSVENVSQFRYLGTIVGSQILSH
jgi:hypothetical protein